MKPDPVRLISGAGHTQGNQQSEHRDAQSLREIISSSNYPTHSARTLPKSIFPRSLDHVQSEGVDLYAPIARDGLPIPIAIRSGGRKDSGLFLACSPVVY